MKLTNDITGINYILNIIFRKHKINRIHMTYITYFKMQTGNKKNYNLKHFIASAALMHAQA